MASYGSTAAASEPLVAKPQGASLKGLIAGAAGASFVLGALAAIGSRRLDAEVRRKLKFGAGRRLSEDN